MAETQGGSHATKSATHSPQRIISCLRRSAACATVSLAGSFEGMRPTGAVGSPRGNTLCPLAGAGSTSGTYGAGSCFSLTVLCPLEKGRSREGVW